MNELEPEVRHEPKGALNGGADGLAALRTIIRRASEVLRPRGSVVLEVGFAQAPEVSRLFARYGYSGIVITKDLGRVDRIVSAVLDAPVRSRSKLVLASA
jgi:release factor glutamine methyltransferase